MTSEVLICNRALQKLGDASIQALTDNTERARQMSMAYEPVRDAELRRRRWKFSIQRASLPRLSTTPDSDFDYEYQLPNDFLRLIEGGDILSVVDLSDYRSGSSELWSIEGRKILTNMAAPLSIRYIAKITDVSNFDSAFCEALSSRLAYECCERITQSSSKKAECKDDYMTAIREAVRANALERAPSSIADDTWLMSRAI